MGREKLTRNDLKLVIEGLKEGIRRDGRGLYEERPVRCKIIHSEPGYTISEAVHGKNRVRADIRLLEEEEGLKRGKLQIKGFRKGESETIKHLETAYRWLRAIDIDGLGEVAGEKAWGVTIHINIISSDGSEHICGNTAIDRAIQEMDFGRKRKIPVRYVPKIVFFSVIETDSGKIIVRDPNDLEMAASSGEIIIILNKKSNEIRSILQCGTPLDYDIIERSVYQAKEAN